MLRRVLSYSLIAAFIASGALMASVEGAADLIYGLRNLQVDLHSPKIGVPVQFPPQSDPGWIAGELQNRVRGL